MRSIAGFTHNAHTVPREKHVPQLLSNTSPLICVLRGIVKRILRGMFSQRMFHGWYQLWARGHAAFTSYEYHISFWCLEPRVSHDSSFPATAFSYSVPKGLIKMSSANSLERSRLHSSQDSLRMKVRPSLVHYYIGPPRLESCVLGTPG